MSDNIVEITEASQYTITIDTSLVQNNNGVTVETAAPNTVEIIDNNIVLVSDLPYGYPLDWTTGNLPIARVSGLDIIGGSGISVSDNSGVYTVAVTGTFGLTGEQVDDRVGNLLTAGSYVSLNYNDNLDFLNISVTGVQPSGNYSIVGHSHSISDVSGLQNVLDSKQPSGIYASGIHTHTSSDITNFSSSVSGLLPVKNITSSSGISVSNNSGDFTISVTGSFGLTSEQVDDRVNDLLKAGSYVNINYNDSLDSLTISVTGVQPSGNYSVDGHTHVIADVSGLQNALDNKQPSGIYASGVHYHTSSDITNFNSSVDSRITLANLQPSGNYSVVGHSHTISDVSGLQNALDNKQPSGSYAPLVHNHYSSDIIDFNNAVSGLIPPATFSSLSGISGVTVSNSGTNYIVSLSDPTIQLTDITDLSSDARSFLLTPSSINLQTLITNETGSGLLVFNDSPTFSGIPTVPTAPSGTNNSQIANTSFVRSEISNLVNSAPSTLDTLNELAQALGSDPNFATTIASGLAQKSNIGHTHTSSEITNFSSTVSGLLPVKNILAGANIDISQTSSGIYSISVTGSPIFAGLTTGANETSFIVDSKGYVTIPGGNASFNSLSVNGTGVSLSGHSHSTSNITNFNSSVSGLLPSVTGSGYITSSFNNNVYTIGVTGLQPSGNYANAIHTHSYNDITNFASGIDEQVSTLLIGGNYIDLNYDNVGDTLTISVTGVQPSGNYANSVHSHGNISSSGTIGSSSGLLVTTTTNGALTTSSGISSSYITNFNSSVSGLLPSVTGTGYVNSSFNNNIYTINVTGLQPSGNYSTIGHTHTASNITDFNTSVSGLLPVKDIIGGVGINVSSSSGIYTVNSTGSGIVADESKSLITTVFNKTGNPIPKFSVVYINGGQGDQPTVSLAVASGEMTSSKTYGVTAETISNMNTGKVIVYGALTGLNTDQFNPTAPTGDVNGTTLWLSPSTPGGVTTIKPSAPNHMVAIGTIVRTHQNAGVVEVRIQNGFELEELHNVAISDVTSGQFLQYNGSGLWVPSSSGNFSTLLVNGTGVSLNGHTHTSSNITDFNSSVSGLLPVTNILAGSNIGVSASGSVFTVAVTGQLGLTTEEVDDRVASLLVAGTGIDLTYNDNLNALVITSVGSSPSGNYALAGHTHTSSSITDFNSSVSGLLPVTNITGGSNISVTQSGTVYTVAVTGSLGLTTEEVDDRVSNLLVAGSGINLNYNDNSNTLTINNTSISPDEIEEYLTSSNLPASGNINILYRTTDDARIYQWNGSVYSEIGPDNVNIGSHGAQHASNGSDPLPNIVSRPAILTANVNNYAHNNADILILDASANRIITGLVAANDGVVKLIINKSLYTITIDHQDVNSNPENRFIVPFGSDYVLQPGYSLTIVYDSDALRWRVLA